MKQKVTIEILDTTVLHLLRNLEAMSLVRFTPEIASESDLMTTRLNEVYKEEESSLDPHLVLAQAEAIGSEDW